MPRTFKLSNNNLAAAATSISVALAGHTIYNYGFDNILSRTKLDYEKAAEWHPYVETAVITTQNKQGLAICAKIYASDQLSEQGIFAILGDTIEICKDKIICIHNEGATQLGRHMTVFDFFDISSKTITKRAVAA